MLLPSAFSCDPSATNASRARYQSALFASPPLSPPTTSSSLPSINGLYSTCRALQSMLTVPNQLPSPPAQHTSVPVPLLSSAPSKLRLRSRKPAALEEPATFTPKKKITKRTRDAAPPRGLNKRRREAEDDMSREDVCDTSLESAEEKEDRMDQPSTPKRMRLAPESIPLGLERKDYHDLHLKEMEQTTAESVEDTTEGNDEWSTEDDRILVELVLEKLKLTKSDWQDCARSLGKDRQSVGRRWNSLMGAGEVGLKNRKRGRIHGTWR